MLALLLGAAPGITSPEVSGAVLFTDSEAARSAGGDRAGVRVPGRAILLRQHHRGHRRLFRRIVLSAPETGDEEVDTNKDGLEVRYGSCQQTSRHARVTSLFPKSGHSSAHLSMSALCHKWTFAKQRQGATLWCAGLRR